MKISDAKQSCTAAYAQVQTFGSNAKAWASEHSKLLFNAGRITFLVGSIFALAYAYGVVGSSGDSNERLWKVEAKCPSGLKRVDLQLDDSFTSFPLKSGTALMVENENCRVINWSVLSDA